jgi:hypothetical protein
MITAAMATMATVDTAKTTRPFSLVVPASKLAGLLLLRARSSIEKPGTPAALHSTSPAEAAEYDAAGGGPSRLRPLTSSSTTSRKRNGRRRSPAGSPSAQTGRCPDSKHEALLLFGEIDVAQDLALVAPRQASSRRPGQATACRQSEATVR